MTILFHPLLFLVADILVIVVVIVAVVAVVVTLVDNGQTRLTHTISEN
jgi:hypothetical protein